jgi:hypothetical protein
MADEKFSWSSCPALTGLDLAHAFRQPLSTFTFPSTLTRLSGVRAEQLDADWIPPAGLLHLAVDSRGAFLVAPSKVKLPPRLRSVHLPGFSEGVDYSQLALPETLESISVWPTPGMEVIRWPKSLRELTFTGGSRLDRLDFCWNDGLEILRLSSFNKPLQEWNPPDSLTELYMAEIWNLALTELHLPPRLHLLQFGSCYNKPIGADDILWPATLKTLRFRRSVDLRQWAPPPNLTRLDVPKGIVGLASMADLRVPPCMRRLLLGGVESLELVFSPEQWPELEYLSVPAACVADWSTVVLPPRLSALCLRLSSSHAWVDSFVRDFHAPSRLRCILTERGPHQPLDGELLSRVRASLPPTCAFLQVQVNAVGE